MPTCILTVTKQSLPTNKNGGVCADALFPTCETQFLGSGGLYGDIIGVDAHDIGETLLHSLHMRVYLWAFGTDGSINVTHPIALRGNDVNCLSQQYLAVNVKCIRRSVGEMKTDVPHIGGAEQRIADGVDKHVGIAVPKKSEGMRNLYSAEPKVPAGNQFVNVIAETYPYFHTSPPLEQVL